MFFNFRVFVLNCVFCVSFLCFVPFKRPLFGGTFWACRTIGATAKRERAGSAEVGPCLTDAAPKAAPGELSVKVKPLRKGPNVNLSGRCGMLFRWCHQHLSSTARDGRSASIQAGVTMIIPFTLSVNDCVATTIINHAT